MWSRRTFLGGLGALAACGHTPRARGANVLLVTFCSLRADRVGWLGYTRRPTTPNLDRFAQDATRFRRAWANATWTNASHASLLTGLFPGHHHVLDDGDVLVAGAPTLPGRLREAGWRTAALVEESSEMSLPASSQVLRDVEQVWRLGDLRTLDPSVLTDWVGADPRPFFALVHLREAHLPFGDGPPFADPASLHPAVRAWQAALPRPGTDTPAVWTEPVDPHAWLTERMRADRTIQESLDLVYDAGVHDTDVSFGRVLDALADRLPQTLVIAVADHGEALIGHKDRLDRSVVHVPMLLRLPGQVGGREVDTDTSHVDLMPTVLDALGLPATAGDGASLIRELDADGPGRSAFTQSAHRGPDGNIVRREAILRAPLRLQQLDDGSWQVELERAGQIEQVKEATPEATALHDELVRLGEDSWMPAPGPARLTPEQAQQMKQQGYF